MRSSLRAKVEANFPVPVTVISPSPEPTHLKRLNARQHHQKARCRQVFNFCLSHRYLPLFKALPRHLVMPSKPRMLSIAALPIGT